MSDRPYVRLYAATVVVGLPSGEDASAAGQRLHDAVVAAGFDIANLVVLQRTTKKQVKATVDAAA